MEIDQSRRLSDNLKRESDRVTWWEGNSTRVWRCSMLVLMSVVSFLGSWMFLEIVELSDKFVTKQDYDQVCLRIDGKLDLINEHLLTMYKESSK